MADSPQKRGRKKTTQNEKTALSPERKPQNKQELFAVAAYPAQSTVYFMSLIKCQRTGKEKWPADITHWKVERGSSEKKIKELNS